ncbi:hypothetical protein M5D96_009226 [Drosophila gunungcola]|uniref:Uncharacterized protein n=1 Tax=Drosophila gunungcola TaxID=103775 RepID=A0A9P9YJ26_9MUSC|nr:hypothetical protein M5D96_009226 [Drosophila gunungcola]
MRDNDALQQEVHSLKTDIGESYQSRIRSLEEKLQQGRPTAEQGSVLSQVAEKLRDIETTLDQKTKVLESLHNSNNASNSASLSVTEDVSIMAARIPRQWAHPRIPRSPWRVCSGSPRSWTGTPASRRRPSSGFATWRCRSIKCAPLAW